MDAPVMRNPFLTVLWIVAIGFIAMGVGGSLWSVWLSLGGSLNYESNGPFVLLARLARSMCSYVTLIGVGTVVGLLFLKLLHPRANHAPTTRQPRANPAPPTRHPRANHAPTTRHPRAKGA